MKKLIIISTLVAFPVLSFSQQQDPEPKYTISTLKYEPTIPADSTYTIVKNDTGEPLTEEVKLEINFHRMKEDYLWRVNEAVEILIHGTE